MPPFIDRVHLYEAVTSQAVPILEAIAVNDNLRSLRRFERDDPPPYQSSTESEEIDLSPPPRGGPMPEELIALMERPLTDDELNSISCTMYKIVRPHEIYHREATDEYDRVDNHRRGPRPRMFQKPKGARRKGVMARHLVKRRWEKLGIWNPDWGFAGRKMQPGDDFRRWTWWWQPKGAADDEQRIFRDGRDLVARAMRLRRTLRRGEHVPALPQSRLGPDTSVAEAEAFLTSRPWFIFQIEMAEEDRRYERLSVEDQRRYPHNTRNQVIKWWKERGDWRDEYNQGRWVDAWKWRHESPSPEPEDLAPIDNMRDNPLDAAAEMEFTPSEIDELETIDLPRSQQPEGFWAIEDSDWPPYFPGQSSDPAERARKREKERIERARAWGHEPSPVPAPKPVFKHNLFGRPTAAEHEEAPAEQHKASGEPQEDAPEPRQDDARPPPQEQRRLRQREPRGGVDRAQNQDQPHPPPPRRSARIAAMKRRAEPLPSETVPNKRPRVRAAPKAAAPAAAQAVPAAQPSRPRETRAKARPVPARAPPPKGETEGRPRRGRGRPRKTDVPSTRSAVGRKPARTPAPARTRNSRAVATTDAPGVPRRRGRPRKNA